MKWCHLSILHIAKLHGSQPIEIKGVELYDVSGYGYKKATDLVNSLKPDLFVVMSFRSLIEMTFQRICKRNGINIVYLEHGLFSKDTLKFRTNKLKQEMGLTVKRQLSFLYIFFGNVIHSSKPIFELKLLWDFYFEKKFNKAPYDHYFIYSKRSFDNYSKLFNMSIGANATYVGYPIFNDEKQKSLAKVSNGTGVLYVHQTLISDGLAFISFDEEKEWLVRIARILEPKYGQMTILLHPRSNLEDYKTRFNGSGIEVVQKPNSFQVFADKALIVGHYSTALLYGLYFEKPTVVLDYPSMKNDDIFVDVFAYVENIDNLKEADFSVNKEKKEYLVGNSNTFEHIAEVLKEYAENQNDKVQ